MVTCIQCLIIPAELGECRGFVVPGIGIGRFDLQCLVIRIDCLFVPAKIIQSDAFEVMGFWQPGKKGKCPVDHDDGFLEPAKIIEFDALPEQRLCITLTHVLITPSL